LKTCARVICLDFQALIHTKSEWQMTKLTRPERWNTAAIQGQKSLEQLQTLIYRLTSEFEEFKEDWIESRKAFTDAINELISLQDEYKEMYPPDNLSESAFSKKLEEVAYFEFDEMIEKIPDLEKFFSPLEEFTTYEFGDLYQAKGFDLPKGYGRD
jgi:hypothetical protein